MKKLIISGLMAIFGILLFLGSYFTVDQGEIGIVTRFGAVKEITYAGLNFKVPFIERVTMMSVRSEKKDYVAPSYSKDLQIADLKFAVNYRINPQKVSEIYAMFGNVDNLVLRIMDPFVSTTVKNVFGKYTSTEAVNDRAKMNAEIMTLITNRFPNNDFLVVSDVQLTNIDYDDAFEASIRDRNTAEVKVKTALQDAEREKVQATIKVIQAQADADSRLAIAKSNALATKLQGEGEASSIEARGKALRENPGVPELIIASGWNGVLPTTMIPGGSVPFINLK